MWFITFFTTHPVWKTSPHLSRSLIKVKLKTLQVCFSQFSNLQLCREKDILAATAKGVLKIFHQNLWKTPVKELNFSPSQARNLQLYKRWGNSEKFSKVLVATTAGSFPDSHFQEHLFKQNTLTEFASSFLFPIEDWLFQYL